MDLLVLGGTAFLSRAVATIAVAGGHRVTCAARGVSGSVPDGAELLVLDRSGSEPSPLTGRRFDAVVDVARTPSWVRSAVAATTGAHWVFVSTVSVYADLATPDQRPEDTPLLEPAETYGALKVECERAACDAVSSMILRPGLIVGPGDPTGRFSYWPNRLADLDGDPRVLAPGAPSDRVQVIDVRDLAAWIVTTAEQRTEGVLDAVGAVQPIGNLLADVAAGCRADPHWVWLDQHQLAAHDIRPWSGERSLPLWVPRPDLTGMLTRDPAPALAAGLELRSIQETARDTLSWLESDPEAAVTGLTRAQELTVLDRLTP